jgi:hypothetical protein
VTCAAVVAAAPATATATGHRKTQAAFWDTLVEISALKWLSAIDVTAAGKKQHETYGTVLCACSPHERQGPAVPANQGSEDLH